MINAKGLWVMETGLNERIINSNFVEVIEIRGWAWESRFASLDTSLNLESWD